MESSSNIDMSELGEKERLFLKDLRRVKKQELIDVARVDLYRRSSISHLLSLIGKKMSPSHHCRDVGYNIFIVKLLLARSIVRKLV